jgi:hypothetical protein
LERSVLVKSAVEVAAWSDVPPCTLSPPSTAKPVVVALVRSVEPKSVEEASCTPFVALKRPPTVVDAVTAKVPVEVAPPKSSVAKWLVEEAKMPDCAQMMEEVAAVPLP